MKTSERIDSGFRKELHFQNNYSFFDKDLRIKQLENRNFIVPWQMVDKVKKDTFVE